MTKKRMLMALGGVAAAALVAACGDDDGQSPAATGGSAGDASGGTTSGTGGSTGGAAGNGTGAVTSTGGSAGSAGAPAGLASITPLSTQLLGGAITPYGLAFAADGKLYVSGATTSGTPESARHLAVWRFDDSMSLDTSFGDGGRVTFDVPGSEASLGLVQVADGSFVVQAVSNGQVYLVKMSEAGVFSELTLIELGYTETELEDIAADCKAAAEVTACTEAKDKCALISPTLAEGICNPSSGSFTQEACNAATTDCSIATGACEATTEAEACEAAYPGATAPLFAERPSYSSWGIALDTSGSEEKIVLFAFGPPSLATSTSEDRVDNDRWIARVMASSFAPDPAFNSGSPYTVDVDGAELNDTGRRGIVEPDGSILSSGYTNFGTGLNNHVVLIRLLPSGAPDPSFGFDSSVAGQTKINPFLAVGGMAEAYAAVRQSTGAYVTTGYGTSNFDAPTKENDLVAFRFVPGALDATWGRLGSLAVQSEEDPTAGLGARAFRENGRDLVALSDDRTLHVGCYDDFAAVFLVGKDGQLDTSFGDGGVIKYAHPTPFFAVALSGDGTRIAATSTNGLLAGYQVSPQ